MNDTITITLSKLHFFAYHGLYPEEKKIGAEFEVELSVSFCPASKITDLDETVNYETLYRLLREEMKKSRELLETFVMEVARAIHHSFPLVKKIEISVTKVQIPLVEFTGNVSVHYLKEYL